MSGEPLVEAGPQGPTIQERLPLKIQRIRKDLPTWVQKTGKVAEATALTKNLDESLKASDLQGAEKTADAILELIGRNP